jgi:hypothetical protein
LLAEFAQTRTPAENRDLKAEVARVQQKMAFHTAPIRRGAAARSRPGSRDIPLGKSLELTGRRERQAIVLQAEVFRNDDLELVVALRAPLDSKPGDSWLARYCAGLSAWEFRTSTVRCDGPRLTLSHSEEIHSINRRRFPRVPVHAPALLAHLPLLHSTAIVPEAAVPPGDVEGATEAEPTAGKAVARAAPPPAPAFVESTVTEFAGPGLRLETRLQVQVDDRVLVMFPLPGGIGSVPTTPRLLAAVGRVKHGRDLEQETGIPDAIDRVWEAAPTREPGAVTARPLSIAIELTGLSDEEIDELASIANELSSHIPGEPGAGAAAAEQAAPYAAAVT